MAPFVSEPVRNEKEDNAIKGHLPGSNCLSKVTVYVFDCCFISQQKNQFWERTAVSFLSQRKGSPTKERLRPELAGPGR